MTDALRQPVLPDSPDSPDAPRRLSRWHIAAVLSVTVLGILALLAWEYYNYYPSQIGPAQPIAFSHRVHAGTKQISCLMCHASAVDTPRAGVPPVETCMLCHSRIIVDHPEILRLTDYYHRRSPVPWVKVNAVPDFVYFNHEAHLRVGFDCGRCHGDVAGMDRVQQSPELTMGVCVQCHRDNNFSHDCLVCHR